MKTYSKILTCAMSIMLLACNNTDNTEQNGSSSSTEQNGFVSSSSDTQSSSSFEVTEMPVRSSKVVAYKKGVNYQVCATASPEKEVLKAAFPHIFDNEKEECNYFPVCVPTASISNDYWILSQDMVLYRIFPKKGVDCGGTDDGFFSAMLVCDDTVEGNLKYDIDYNTDVATIFYDPDWDCREGNEESRDVFF